MTVLFDACCRTHDGKACMYRRLLVNEQFGASEPPQPALLERALSSNGTKERRVLFTLFV